MWAMVIAHLLALNEMIEPDSLGSEKDYRVSSSIIPLSALLR
jgi:hypothetical protein